MTNPITPDTVRALLEAATPGPWQVMPDGRARVKLDHVESGYGSPAGMGSPVCSIPRARAGDAELCAAAPAIALAYLDACAERDRLARIIDNPGDYTQTWKPTYNELVGIAHAQTVTVTVPSVVIRDHLRARLDADRAGGSDV